MDLCQEDSHSSFRAKEIAPLEKSLINDITSHLHSVALLGKLNIAVKRQIYTTLNKVVEVVLLFWPFTV